MKNKKIFIIICFILILVIICYIKNENLKTNKISELNSELKSIENKNKNLTKKINKALKEIDLIEKKIEKNK